MIRPNQGQGGRDVWWINKASDGYQELAAQWAVRAGRLHSHPSVTPLIKRARAWRDGAVSHAPMPLGGAGGQLLTDYLASQGLEVYVNALSAAQEAPWKWRWGDLHGEHYGSLEEALIAALHSKMG